MAHDLVVRGGTVVDGLGSLPVQADVSIDAGRITGIGTIEDAGGEEILATGCIITPGFIDLHTHLDAQIGWDPHLTPSSWHGVTTVLTGNCGMTFAPVRPGDRAELAAMMETVEDIPASAILDGLPWTWESFAEYLDFVGSSCPALNVAGLVGHAALRFYAMGPDAIDGDPSPDQIAAQADLVADALAAGAAGFSTSRYERHLLPDGRCVPGTFASDAEVLSVASTFDSSRLFQAVLRVSRYNQELQLLGAVADRTGGTVLFNTAVSDDPTSAQPIIRHLAHARSAGRDLFGMIGVRPGGVLVGLQATLPWHTDGWVRLARLPFVQRVDAISDASTRAALVEEAADAMPFVSPDQIFPLGGGDPDYMRPPDQSLASLARAANESLPATFLRLTLESAGRAMFSGRFFNRSIEALTEAIVDDTIVPGLGDAGAHVGQIMDASWTTFFLTHWVRDTRTIGLTEGVRRITSFPASILGLPDRGRIEIGSAADLNVIDLDHLRSLPIEVVHDLPGGARRFIQRAVGYRATIVNGVVIQRDDTPTGRRPGCVLREFSRGAR